jgi:hypothetical protein
MTFLQEVHTCVYVDERTLVDWDSAQKAAFLSIVIPKRPGPWMIAPPRGENAFQERFLALDPGHRASGVPLSF